MFGGNYFGQPYLGQAYQPVGVPPDPNELFGRAPFWGGFNDRGYDETLLLAVPVILPMPDVIMARWGRGRC